MGKRIMTPTNRKQEILAVVRVEEVYIVVVLDLRSYILSVDFTVTITVLHGTDFDGRNYKEGVTGTELQYLLVIVMGLVVSLQVFVWPPCISRSFNTVLH
jgi:hypothetical protein